MDDFHDGVNYMRTACVIAVSRAKDMFEPFVHQARPLPPPTTPRLTGIEYCLTH